MKTKFPISLSITIMISFHLLIIFTNWFVLKEYNNSIQNDAKIINTIGQIRGGAQKYFKIYFYGDNSTDGTYINNKFIILKSYLDNESNLSLEKVNELEKLWNGIYSDTKKCMMDNCKKEILIDSERFWAEADKTVKFFEQESLEKNDLIKVVFVILFLEMVFVSIMILIVYRLVNDTLESQTKKMENYINVIDKYVITSSTDLKGKITYVSEAFCEISGYSKEELLGKNHNVVRHDDMPSNIYEVLWNTIKQGDTWVGEIKNKKKNNEFYWVKAHISPIIEEKKIVGYTAVREDITTKKVMEELSVTDPLTGLYNRRKFHEVVVNELARVKRDIQDQKTDVHQVFFIIIDVDHFKLYNDNYGHDQGDVVLKEIANLMQLSLRRATDFAFRIGGEEFGIMVVDDNILNVKEYASSIQKSIEDMKIEHMYNSASDYVTASFGISMSNKHFGYDLDDLYNRADKALYRAKELGRNRVEVFKVTGENHG